MTAAELTALHDSSNAPLPVTLRREHAARPHAVAQQVGARLAPLRVATFRLPEIPGEVVRASEAFTISALTVDLEQLPAVWHVGLEWGTCWIACAEAWPHTDPNWEGQLFITLALQADHSFGYVGPAGERVELPIFPGTLFVLDPMTLHWLRPNNPQCNPGFAALQWEVDAEQAEGLFHVIAAAARP